MTSTIPTIRSVLTRWFTITMSLVLLGIGGIVSLLLWRVLFNQIDHHLHTVMAEAYEIVSTHAPTERDILLQKFVGQNSMTIVLMTHNEEVLLETNSPDVAAVTEAELKKIISSPTTVANPSHLTVNQTRFSLMPVSLNEEPGVLAVGYNLNIVTQAFLTLLVVLIISLAITFVLVFYGANSVLYRYLLPLETIARQAERINPQNLHLRVNTVQETREVKTLTDAINGMIKRLENIFKTEHEFFSDAAHTLKTPLAVVRGQLETASGMNQTQKDQLLTALDAATVNISDLLLVSRLQTTQTGELTRLSLSALLKEITAIAQTLGLEKHIIVNSRIEPHVYIKANPSLLKRALSNLIQNAINYNQVKGVIEITCQKNHSNSTVKVTIANTGSGIGKKDLSKVKERFFRGENAKATPGSGLGLSIAHTVIEAIGGTLTIGSALNGKTTVTITLPGVN